jgi:hypothetical protein
VAVTTPVGVCFGNGKFQMKRLSRVWENKKKEFGFSDDIFAYLEIQI